MSKKIERTVKSEDALDRIVQAVALARWGDLGGGLAATEAFRAVSNINGKSGLRWLLRSSLRSNQRNA